MTKLESKRIYEIELCSGERVRWQYLGPDSSSVVWWRDLETGNEFNEASRMYAWRVIGGGSPSEEVDAMNTVPDLYRLLTEQIADALIYAGLDGKIGAWNGAAEVLFGYSKAEASGQSLDLIIPERLRPAHWTAFDRAMALGATRLGGKAMLTRAQTRAGNAIYVEMSFAVVSDDNGKAIGAVAVARDATARHRDDKALRERLAELEKANAGPSPGPD